MKIEIDTINDSVDELKKTIAILQEALERKTGVTAAGIKAPPRPSEFKKEEPKIIFEDILDVPGKKSIVVPASKGKEKLDIKKRKVLRQDEKEAEKEEEDEDRHLPKIQYRDYW
jgi:hypothetical protein